MNKLIALIGGAAYMVLGLLTVTPEYEEQADPIVGTWRNIRGTYFESELDEWVTLYRTCFSPDGQVVHYGCRNVDRGTWQRIDENTVTAVFDDCTYMGIGGNRYAVPSYSVTYTYNRENKGYLRDTDREKEFFCEKEAEGGSVIYKARDFDDYGLPLWFESDESEIADYYADLPKTEEYGITLEKRLLAVSGDLFQGKVVELEQADLPYQLENITFYDITGDGKKEMFAYVETCNHTMSNSGAFYVIAQEDDGGFSILSKNANFRGGYTDILAADGTQLLPTLGYASASSWKGGVRIHLGFREGEVVVDKKESYRFHGDFPLLNYVNDYKNGSYCVYAARCEQEGEGYGYYVSPQESMKIDEEFFEPRLFPFTEYGYEKNEYPAVYDPWNPFDTSWWQDGGKYPEDGEAYGSGMARWIEQAKDDNPNELLKNAVENSGLELERRAYPWTTETKKNVSNLLRCPVADYYYISDFYAAAYKQGEIYYYIKRQKSYEPGEKWEQVSIDDIYADMEKTAASVIPIKVPESFTVREEGNTRHEILLSDCSCWYEENQLIVYSYDSIDKKGIYLLAPEVEKIIYPLADYLIDQDQDAIWILEEKENPLISRIDLRRNPYLSKKIVMDAEEINGFLAKIYGIPVKEGEALFSDLEVSFSKEENQREGVIKGIASGILNNTNKRYCVEFEIEKSINIRGYLQSLFLPHLYQEFLYHNLTVKNPFTEKGKGRELGFFDEEVYAAEFTEPDKRFALYDYNEDGEDELLFQIKQTEYHEDTSRFTNKEVIYVLGVQDGKLVCMDIIEILGDQGENEAEDKEKADVLDRTAAWFECEMFCDIPEK